MKIKSIKIKRFKRFTDLTVSDIPETVKLVVLVGPNGSGKTSLFEAFNHWYKMNGGYGASGSQDYHEKKDGTPPEQHWYNNKVDIELHGSESYTRDSLKGKFYFRSAYRNEPDFTMSNLNQQNDPTKSIKLNTLMQTDQTVSENYQRLVAKTISGVYDTGNDPKTVSELRDELFGKITKSLSSIFDNLNLSSIGDPLTNGSFYFEKGASKDFHYKNLSAGEKSVFDLILDIIIKESYYADAVWCIDEPEAHMHTRLQSKVLEELYNLTPSHSQLWISSHSIGMLKQAEDIEKQNPGTVVFLDFDNRDFDSTEIIKPAKINKTIWNRFIDLAFGDFSELLAPRRIVFCEGTSKGRKYKDFDAQIYGQIFESKYHDTKFVSIGSCNDIENNSSQPSKIVSNILRASEIIKFVDRDDKSDNEVNELGEVGIKTSKRRHLECYLLDDELITKLCSSIGKPDMIENCINAKNQAIQESVSRGNPSDDVKSASGQIFNLLKQILVLTQCGNNSCAFIRDTMTALATEDTNIYKELEAEIFG